MLLPEACIERLEDRREIKNLLGKYAVHLHLCQYDEIFEKLWCRWGEDVALGFNDGRYRGREAIKRYYKAVSDKIMMASRLLKEALPLQFESKDEKNVYGAGHLEFKPVQMPVIEIDKEGKYADAYWYSQGTLTEVTSAGPLAFWTFGSFHVKCMREENEWRINMLDYFEDIKVPVGQNWCCPSELAALPEFAQLKSCHIPEPNEKAKLYERYWNKRELTRIPEPATITFLDFDKCLLSEEEASCLQAVIDRDEIEQIMGRRTIYAINEEREKEINELWVSTPDHIKTACFGGTWGFHIGLDKVYEYYVMSHKRWLYDYPLGLASAHPLRTSTIQIAKDEKTAKGIWYSLGHITTGGEDAFWVGRKIAVDFIKENGRFKIWHLCEVHDSTLTPGEDFGNQNPALDSVNDPLRAEFGIPTITVKTHERLFCWTDDFPYMPEPYETMLPELEYSAEGFYARQKEGVDNESAFVNITEDT